ncbi:MAG: Sec23/Sec24 zinc finger-containing protein [archaeon]|nr:Sec23/Sec24 zinc finger-containing protein [archaeon]
MSSITSPFQNQGKKTNNKVSSPFGNSSSQSIQEPQRTTNIPPKASSIQQNNFSSVPSAPYQTYNTQMSDFDLVKDQFNSLKQFNCNPCFICPTSEVFPSNLGTLKDSNFPIGLSISPLSNINQEQIPILRYGQNDIPRCPNNNCRAYLNPFVKFIEGGDKWICNFCKQVNPTEHFYFCKCNNEGIREDQMTKTELCNGTYEFETNEKYWKRGRIPTKSLFIFMIETSSSSIQSGYLTAIIESIKEVVNNNSFYNSENAQVAILTYDTSVAFYSFSEKMNQPQMLCVANEPVFVPTVKENLILNVQKDKDHILAILDLIENSFNNNPTTIKDSNKIISCLNGAYLLGKDTGGKVIIFSSSNSLTGNPKLNTVSPSDNLTKEQLAYSAHDKRQLGNMGINLTNANMSVDLFLSAESSINLYTMNQLPEYSNGSIYFYKNFKLDLHYKSIYNQIIRVLSREISWEGVLRTRFSHGYKISEFLTPVLISNKDLFVLPTGDSDQHYQIGLSLLAEDDAEAKNTPSMKDNFLYVQSALLYSYGDGTRRIRIHNLCIPLSNRVNDIYENANCEMTSLYFMKATIDKLYKAKSLTTAVINSETNFKSLVTSIFNNIQSRKREFPNSLAFLPLYFLGMSKNRVFCRDELDKKFDIDLSNYLRIKLQRMDVNEAMRFILPNIYPLYLIYEDQSIGNYDENGDINIPQPIGNSVEALENGGLFLIDNGFLFIIFVKKNAPSKIIKHLFGVENVQFIAENVTEGSVFENMDETKQRIMNIIDSFRGWKSIYQNLIFSFEGTNGENIVYESLIENNCCKWYPFDYATFYKKMIN